ncbi:MAG: hypothetical protein ACPKOI_05680 [Pleomorphochaeta sp.]
MPIKKQNSSANTFHGLEKESVVVTMPKVFLDNLRLSLKAAHTEMTVEELILHLTMIGATKENHSTVFKNVG